MSQRFQRTEQIVVWMLAQSLVALLDAALHLSHCHLPISNISLRCILQHGEKGKLYRAVMWLAAHVDCNVLSTVQARTGSTP